MGQSAERLILLTNDDGIQALGLASLRREMEAMGQVFVVAPSEERSASSHSLTIHEPVRIRQISDQVFSVSGTPVDCVIFALRKILPRDPDLVVSGINHGANLGDDVHYSGTVAAAREASLYGIPAAAVSLLSRGRDDYGPAAALSRRILAALFPLTMPPGTLLNINIPGPEASEFRFTRQGSKRLSSAIEEKTDPRGRHYYWIREDRSEWVVEAETDFAAIRDGVVSVTPLQRDYTDYQALRFLRTQELGCAD